MRPHIIEDLSGFEREYRTKWITRKEMRPLQYPDRHWHKAERKKARKTKHYLAEVVREQLPARPGIMVNGEVIA